MYYSSSEFVSHGHPDRLADNLAACLIDKIQKKDGPNSHAAVEVFLTRDTVIFSGEVTTTLTINDSLLKEVVVTAFRKSGYIPEMRAHWSKSEVLLEDDVKIENRLVSQSPDIALGTTDKGLESGYNDQGVFFSSSDNSNESHLGLPMKIAQDIGDFLSYMSLKTIQENYPVVLGPDNKVVVTVAVGEDGFTPVDNTSITAITIAVAHSASSDLKELQKFVRSSVEEYLKSNESNYHTGLASDCNWIINGTGRFVVHGSVSDTSMTGRKISVNHPSAGPVWSNKMIGGGSLVKPWHASDFILNVASRFISNVVVYSKLATYAVVGCASAIGQYRPQSLFIKSDCDKNAALEQFFLKYLDLSPRGLAELFGFFDGKFDFLSVVDANFFGNTSVHPWDNPVLISKYSTQLIDYLNGNLKEVD